MKRILTISLQLPSIPLAMVLFHAFVSFLATPVCAQTIGLNFTGSTLNQSGFRPPDTMGTVGPDHIVELINGRYSVYDKVTGGPMMASSLDVFWTRAGAVPTGNFSFDPRVQYDPSVGRFYASSVDNSTNPNNFLFAVSNSSNPLDGWTGFSVDSDTDNMQWADFPQMGFSADSIIISANMFGINDGDPFEINMLVIPKADVTGGSPTLANATLLESQFAATGFGFSLQSAIDLQNSSRPLRLLSNSSSPPSELLAVQINGAPGSPVVNDIPDVTGLTAYNSPPLADQPGGVMQLDSGGNRTRSAITLINDDYYGIHGVEDPVTGNAALQWYRIDADTLAVEAEGLIADDALDLIYGSIAANAMGDIVIGFTASGPNEFASAYAVVGATDGVGDVTFGGLLLLKPGQDTYDGTFNNRNRWGDYSATVLDPENPLRFWTFQEFVSAEDVWAVQITEILVPEPTSVFLVGAAALVSFVLRRKWTAKEQLLSQITCH